MNGTGRTSSTVMSLRGRALWAVAVLGVGCWQLSLGWASAVAGAVFVGVVVLVFGLVLGARVVRVPGGFVVLGVLTAALVGAYYAAPASGPLQAVVDSVPRLLTAPRPAPVTAAFLVPGVLLVAVVALVSALSLRARALVVPAVGGAVLYVAGALLTAGRADPRGLGALGLLAVTGIGWVLVDRGRRRGSVVPQSVLVVGLAGVALAAVLLPAGRPFEPRDLVTPPVNDLPASSPLPALSSWAAAGDTELFRVRGGEIPMRLVALADYTGATWQATTVYSPVGTVAAPDLPAGARHVETRVDVTIGDLTGPWLPAPGRPTATSAEDAVVDASSGSVVLPSGARQGFEYTVESSVDAPDDADLIAASVPGGGAARRYLGLPDLPFALAEYARRTVADARTPFEKAVAIEEVVRADRRPNAEAPVGSSYARLSTFLFGAPGTAGAGEGTAEQFASAYAVLARAVGLPTRVVVGFRPVPPGPDGVAVVRAADATAWPEVYFSGWGWVPFDPVSGTDDGPASASRREVINRLATATPTPSTPAVSGPAMPSKAQVPDAAPTTVVATRKPWYLVIIAVPVLVLVVLGGLRAGRRSRLRRAGATGAWAYVLDSLLLAGRTPPRASPAPEIANGLATPEARRLAVLADRAAFAPNPAPAEVGRAAWPLALRVRATLRRRVPWYRRLFWAIDPRPLWRR
ncbi:transglutaminase domain-containing protein [Actinophytocola oryzae]|uniref:Transglutaminase superfamily protein n=1 Tax=Actinophytocola oryzae TaxID=502181 RepID=A0A4R7W3D5_9PSEU|nr:transglutaminase domain-containing protein [Actinophytocola oryzae]TDV57160.1 transglutaminase superfamily protein [Actinophytocola oryzae]